MSRKLITLGASSNVYEAIDVFNNNKLSCIPIVDKDTQRLWTESP